MEKAEFQGYLKLLRELTKTLRQLTELERRKLAAVRANDVQAVDDCIRQEQVLSLSLRGAEQRRGKLLKELGLEQEPLSKLAGHAPEELRQETREAMKGLRDSYDEYKSSSDAARSALERVLHDVDRMLADAKREAPRQSGLRRSPRQEDGPPPEGGHGADFMA